MGVTSQQTIGEFHDSRQPPASDTAALQIRGLSKIFSKAKTVALQDTDLDIHPGEMVCLIGESGCGKSTLLQMIAGFDFPTTGTIAVGPELVSGPSYKRGVVFQESSLLPWLTVEENIVLGLEISRQGPWKTPRRTVTMLCFLLLGSLFWAIALALPIKVTLERDAFAFDCHCVIPIVVIGSSIAVLFGLLVELIWQDESLAEPIGETL